jgi:hypothetical protein
VVIGKFNPMKLMIFSDFLLLVLALVGDLNLNGAFVYPKTWKRKLKKLLLKVAPNG